MEQRPCVDVKMEERISKERRLWQAIELVGSVLSGLRRRNLVPAEGLLGWIPDENEEEMHQLAKSCSSLGCMGRLVPDDSSTHPRCSHRGGKQTERRPFDGCLEKFREAATELERMGFWWQRWAELRDGKRPPQNDARDPGVWPHGWQHWASVVSDTHSGDQFAVTHRQNTRRAHGEQCTHLILSHLISTHLIVDHCVVSHANGTRAHPFRLLLLEGLHCLSLETQCSGVPRTT